MRRFIILALVIILFALSLVIGAISIHDLTRTLLIQSRLPRLFHSHQWHEFIPAGAIMQLLTSNRFVTPATGSTTEWAAGHAHLYHLILQANCKQDTYRPPLRT